VEKLTLFPPVRSRLSSFVCHHPRDARLLPHGEGQPHVPHIPSKILNSFSRSRLRDSINLPRQLGLNEISLFSNGDVAELHQRARLTEHSTGASLSEAEPTKLKVLSKSNEPCFKRVECQVECQAGSWQRLLRAGRSCILASYTSRPHGSTCHAEEWCRDSCHWVF